MMMVVIENIFYTHNARTYTYVPIATKWVERVNDLRPLFFQLKFLAIYFFCILASALRRWTRIYFHFFFFFYTTYTLCRTVYNIVSPRSAMIIGGGDWYYIHIFNINRIPGVATVSLNRFFVRHFEAQK